MIKPTQRDIDALVYQEGETEFKIIENLKLQYNVYGEQCVNEFHSTIIQGPDNVTWRITYIYDSWNDDNFKIEGPVTEYQVIHDEYLTQKEFDELNERGKIVQFHQMLS